MLKFLKHFPGFSFVLFLGLMALILALDSLGGAGQALANVATLIYFLLTYRSVSPRLKRFMLIGLLVGCVGEVCFSLILHMYEYRVKNIPLYVIIGHPILYSRVFLLVHSGWIQRYAPQLKVGLFAGAAVFSGSWLLFRHDLYGFVCFGAFSLLVLAYPNSRLFFLTMYFSVAYLELVGTSFGCWHWPPGLLNRWQSVSSANPPSSISVFYMGFDLACFGIYLLLNSKRRQRYNRFRTYRKSVAQI